MAQVEVGFNTESGTWFGTLNGETVITGQSRDATYSHMREVAIVNEASFVMRNKKGGITLQFKSFRGHNKATRSRTAENPLNLVAPTNIGDVIEQIEPSIAPENDMMLMPVSYLVALYNDLGGNITGKYKGSKAALVQKITALQG